VDQYDLYLKKMWQWLQQHSSLSGLIYVALHESCTNPVSSGDAVTGTTEALILKVTCLPGICNSTINDLVIRVALRQLINVALQIPFSSDTDRDSERVLTSWRLIL